MNSSEDLIYSTGTVVAKTVLCNWNLLGNLIEYIHFEYIEYIVIFICQLYVNKADGGWATLWTMPYF